MTRKQRWRVSNLESNVIPFFQLGKPFITQYSNEQESVTTMAFFRKMQKELEQKYNSENQNNQPVIEFLQSAATSDIGRVDMQVISDFVSSEKSVNRSPQYRKSTDKQKYTIGKYAAENGNANTLRKFKREFPNLSESTVRTFKKRYYEEVRKWKEELEESKSITKYARKTGRPYLLDELDEMGQKHIRSSSKKKCNEKYCRKRNRQGSR